MQYLTRLAGALAVGAAALLLSASARADRAPHAGMMRYPDVSATDIVFSYADDLWVVPRGGGMARPLASPPGNEAFPRFSADGQTIAFVGNYDGNNDLYTVATDGGVPFRVTHHPSTEILCDWTPDGKLLFFSNNYVGLVRQTQLFTVPADGGLPEQLPVPYGANGAISPDGVWLAYTPHSRDSRTWKRYRGGMATDIWLFNLKSYASQKITDWEGTDSQPMWHGTTVYYISDAGPNHRLNIWAYDTESRKREQVTTFEEYDVKWPAMGPGPNGGGEIVFQNGPRLYLLDLTTRQAQPVDVSVPGDRPKLRPQLHDVSDEIRNTDISSTGKRGVFEARGDIWTVPAEKGTPRNLTRSDGTAERDPSWSPDGKWIAYFSDKTGEYELYVVRSDGRGTPTQLTDATRPEGLPADAEWQVFRYYPVWSPDSKHIAFSDKAGRIYIHTLETRTTKYIDQEPWAQWQHVNWSHDSNWIAYTKGGDNLQSSIWLYNVPEGEAHQVTSGMFNDTAPAFDRKGDYLFLASNRRFADPIYADMGDNVAYARTDVLLVVPLRDDVKSPWLAESDEETWDKKKEEAKKEEKKESEKKDKEEPAKENGDDGNGTPSDTQNGEEGEEGEQAGEEKHDEAGTEKDGDKEKEGKEKKDEEKPLEIDLDGFEARAIRIPVDPGAFYGLSVNDAGQLLYVRRPLDGEPAIKIFDLKDEKKEEKTVLAGVGGYSLSADGKKILVRKGRTFAIIDAKANQKLDKPMPLAGMTALIAPRDEWRQIFNDAWRIQRDFFYVANMHGVDWPAVHDQYAAMLDDCVSRSDLSFIIGEMIAELNIGHAYYWGGDVDRGPSVSVGMLGCDFALDPAGAYRIKDIIEGAAWDVDARGPLSEPGVHVREGDYLLAVNGVPLDTSEDPWAAFQGLAGQTVTLTVSDKPALEAVEDRPGQPETKESEEAEEAEEAEAAKDDEATEDKDEEKAEEKDPYAGQRDVVIKLLSNDSDLRYRQWVEQNRKYVEEHTDGKVGYIHVPDTGIHGQNELFRQFYGQRDKAALIVDERWNGGGQLPHRFIELLNRPPTNYWARRDGHDWPSPETANFGPKCMLINGLAGSGGDMFPWLFRFHHLGPIIGMRTWGGLVGISGNPGLIDGGYTSVPTFGFYKLNGTWGVEGHGVDPDIEVVDDPALMADGSDPQLDKGIEVMLTAIQDHPFAPPQRPAPPDRSGMTVLERDY